MRCASRSVGFAAALLLAACGAPPAADAPAAVVTVATRGFTGVWVPTARSRIRRARRPGQTRRGREIRRSRNGARPNRAPRRSQNFAACTPGGPVFHMWEIGLFPMQILEAPGQFVIMRETSGMPRRIYTDGRGHPRGSRADVDGPFDRHGGKATCSWSTPSARTAERARERRRLERESTARRRSAHAG